MEFKVKDMQPIDGMVEVQVHHHEKRKGLDWNCDLSLWVPTSDSIHDIKEKAREELKTFLLRVLSKTFTNNK